MTFLRTCRSNKYSPNKISFIFRTVLVTAAVVLAVAVPTISPFIGLIGAFCFSILGLLIPVSILLTKYMSNAVIVDAIIVCSTLRFFSSNL